MVFSEKAALKMHLFCSTWSGSGASYYNDKFLDFISKSFAVVLIVC